MPLASRGGGGALVVYWLRPESSNPEVAGSSLTQASVGLFFSRTLFAPL